MPRRTLAEDAPNLQIRHEHFLHRRFGWLLKYPVAVEKLHFSQNGENLGDRKCLPKRRSSFVGLPIAKFFRPVSGERVFQQPQAIALRTPGCRVSERNRDVSPAQRAAPVSFTSFQE
jgi:hypothetical protein